MIIWQVLDLKWASFFPFPSRFTDACLRLTSEFVFHVRVSWIDWVMIEIESEFLRKLQLTPSNNTGLKKQWKLLGIVNVCWRGDLNSHPPRWGSTFERLRRPTWRRRCSRASGRSWWALCTEGRTAAWWLLPGHTARTKWQSVKWMDGWINNAEEKWSEALEERAKAKVEEKQGKMRARETDGMRAEGEGGEEGTNKQRSVGDGGDRTDGR